MAGQGHTIVAGSPDAAGLAALYAPHGLPGRFFNPWGATPRGLSGLLRWKLGANPYDKSAPPRVPVAANDGAYLADPRQPASVTWVGHSTFAIQDSGSVLLTDPHWGPRALLPPRLSPPGLPLGAVPPDALVVLSHNHYDHLDAWTVARLPPSIAWYVPLGVGDWLRRRRYAGSRPVVELDWWQSARHGPWTLTCLPAQHWSNRLGTGRDATLWCSWLLDCGGRRYYFAGDTGYFAGFSEFARRFGPCHAALLPIGAYEPRWFMRPVHMSPQDAYRAFQDLQAGTLLPMHWGAFDLTNEPVDLAPRVLAAEVARQGGDPARVRTLEVGGRWWVTSA